MRAVDVIHKKRLGEVLTANEIEFLIQGYVQDSIPDYQMSAFSMAVCFQGMTSQETAHLTKAMVESGDKVDLSGIDGIKVDKHSTGGVGDTTTLVLGPMVAALGVPVAKMSGRGLGHTGGTLDKLESISGFHTDLSRDELIAQVKDIGLAVAGQTANLTPADKKLYALRDVTDTVQSIPLIASSIMSKKLASGADAIVLDVKVGDGAFMKDFDEARTLAEAMVAIGEHAGRKTVAVLTTMEQPLGHAIGNALEVREAIATLRGEGPADLTELCLTLGAEMVMLAGAATSVSEARDKLRRTLENGAAIEKFKEFVRAQGGDHRVADDPSLLPKAPVVTTWRASSDGYVATLHAEEIGRVAMRLGAGRTTHDADIHPAVGLVLQRKVGESVRKGEAVVEIYARSETEAAQAAKELDACIEIVGHAVEAPPLLLDIVREATGTDEASDTHGTSETDEASETHRTPETGGASETHKTSKTDVVRAGEPDLAQTAAEDATGASVRDEQTDASASRDLVQAARGAMKKAYVPYSHFPVGAALQLSNGEVVTGANIENASYGLTNCAERTAIFRARMLHDLPGDTSIVAIAVVADSEGAISPCGACRQVMAEFCEASVPVVLTDLQGDELHTTVGDLLPYAFDSRQMDDRERPDESRKGETKR